MRHMCRMQSEPSQLRQDGNYGYAHTFSNGAVYCWVIFITNLNAACSIHFDNWTISTKYLRANEFIFTEIHQSGTICHIFIAGFTVLS